MTTEHTERVAHDALHAVIQARSALDGFAYLEREIAVARLAVLKGEPGRTLDEIRAAQQELQHERELAREELAAAEATLRLAERELEEARRK